MKNLLLVLLDDKIKISVKLDGIEEKKLPSECIGCKKCMKHCPQGIAILDYMKKLACLKATGKEE